MTSELCGASEAAVTTATTCGVQDGRGSFPIEVHTTGEAVPSSVRTTCWHAATRCFGASGFMLKVGKKLHEESVFNCEGVIGYSGPGVAPGADLVILQKFVPYWVR